MNFGKMGARGGFGSLGALGSVGKPYVFVNAEAAAVAAAFTTPATNARKALIDNLIGSLKSAGVWTLLDALWLTAAADSQAARINWKTPATFTLSPGNSPSFAADRGFSGDGSASFLNTGYVPSTAGLGMSLNSAHISGWSLSAVPAAGTQRMLGNISATTNRSFMIPRNTSDIFTGILNDGTSLTAANATSSGQFILNRSGASARQVYGNGLSIGSDAIASAGLPTTAIVLDRDTTNFATLQIAQASIGQSLSGTQVTAFYSALLSYMQALGAA